MRLLIKYPSRYRSNMIAKRTEELLATSVADITIVYTVDEDDRDSVMTALRAQEFVNKKGCKAIVVPGRSRDKIHAVNRDMELINQKVDWDVLLLMSDDMEPSNGWDRIVSYDMQQNFPDTDGSLFYNDGYAGLKLNTMPIIGRKYYDRFGYIYNPEYRSLWCDNEFTQVGFRLKRQVYSDIVVFRHRHYANDRTVNKDNLYIKNDRFNDVDKSTYQRRLAKNFYLP